MALALESNIGVETYARVGAALISMLQVTYKLNGSGARCTGGAPNARGGRRMHTGAPNAPEGRRMHRGGAERTGRAPDAPAAKST